MKQDTHETTVIFRKWRGTKDIIALFPYVKYSPGLCHSYMHVGQHGSAEYIHCIRSSVPATEEEYKDLKAELEGIGYKLKIRKKRTRR